MADSGFDDEEFFADLYAPLPEEFTMMELTNLLGTPTRRLPYDMNPPPLQM
jgi:hypothetical protein